MLRHPFFQTVYYFLLLGALLPVAAQTPHFDSLYAIWSDTTNNEVLRLEAYMDRFRPLQNELRNEEVFRWSVAVDEALALAEAEGQTNYSGRLQMIKSGYYIALLQNLEEGCPLTKEAYLASLAAEDFASAYYTLIFMVAGNCDLPSFQEQYGHPINLLATLSSSMLEQSPVEEQMALFTLGSSIAFLNQHYPEALTLSQKVVDHYQAHDPLHEDYAMSLETLSRLHHHIGNYELAAKYLQLRGALERQLADPYTLGSYYIDLAENQLAQQLLPQALQAMDSARIIMSGQAKCEPCQMRMQRILASIENRKGNYAEALRQLLQILPFYQYEGSYPGNNHLNVGLFYTELGNTYLGLHRYDEAIAAVQEGLKRFDYYLLAGDQHKILYQSKQAQGRHQEALQHYQSYIEIRDSLTQVRNSQLVTRMELQSQYERQRLADSLQVEQKRLQTELALQGEINRQKSNRNVIMGLGLGALLIAFGQWRRIRLIRQNEVALAAKNTLIEQEKENAQASERAKHQFLANMSHEIRTPMNAIKGMTDILLRRDPKTSQLQYLQGIKQSSDSLLFIINDILDLSKIESGKIELEQMLFSLPEQITQLQQMMRFKAEEKGLELHTKVPAELPLVLGDPTRLRQILLNLVSNAIKFTEKGVITIVLALKHQSSESLALQCTVSDTGVGIGADRLEKIFESFEQAYSDTTRKFGGTGLGLSISKKLVELHGGRIWVDSQKGQGSQFHFTLSYALASAASQPEPVVPPQVDPATLANVRVLLVEDNDFNALVAKEELEDAVPEVQVTIAENGAIALEKIRSQDYDLILMDVQMPVLNGYDTTSSIRALAGKQSQIPIIAMTANVMKEEVARCYAAGMDDFIGKPFDVEVLLTKMAHLYTAR